MSRARSFSGALGAYVRGRDRVWELDRKRGDAVRPPAEIEFGHLPRAPRFGVSVAEELDFRRGPAAWRDRDPPPRS